MISKILIPASIIAAMTFISCGKKEEDDEEESTSKTPTSSTSSSYESTNELASSFPGTLALSVFPQDVDLSLNLQDEATEDKTAKEQIEERVEIINGEGDCAPPLKPRQETSVTCYEFDNDMNPFNNGPAGNGGTKDGKHTDGEACMVAFARQEVLNTTQHIDSSLGIAASMLCAAKKADAGLELPKVDGDPLDLSTYLKSAGGGKIDKVQKATIAAVQSTDNDEIGYLTTIVMDIGGKKRKTQILYFEESESGQITAVEPAGGIFEGAKLQDENNTENMNRVIDVRFSRAGGKNKVKIDVANILNTIDPFKDGSINYAGIPQSAENSTANSFYSVRFDMDDESVGKLSYWRNPGGRHEESARGFLFDIEEDDGKLSGCGVSGATSDISIRASATDSSKDLKPVRYWHPFAGNNTHADKDSRYTGGGQGPLVTVQCFTQNSTSGLYELDNEKTAAVRSATGSDLEAINTRGYDVVPQETSATKFTPPEKPKAPPKGEFIKDDVPE